MGLRYAQIYTKGEISPNELKNQLAIGLEIRNETLQMYQTLLLIYASIGATKELPKLFSKYSELMFPEVGKERSDFVEDARALMEKIKKQQSRGLKEDANKPTNS